MSFYKKTVFYFVLFFTVSTIYAQELSSPEVEQLINSTFSRLVTGNTTNSLGSFVSVDLGDSEVEYSPTFRLSPRQYLNFTAKGGASNGVFNAIKNSSLNSNVGIGFQMHFLDTSSFSNVIRFMEKDHIAYRAAKKEILEDFFLDSLNVIYNKEAIDTYAKVNILDREINIIQSRLKKTTDSKTTDSLILELRVREYKKENLTTDLNKISQPLWGKRELLRIGNNRAARLDSLEKKLLPITGFNVSWFSFGYEATNDAFKLYDALQDFDNQLTKRSVVSHNFNIQFSTAKLARGNFHSYYSSLMLRYKLRNNLTELDKVSITNSSRDTSSSGQVRIINEEISALTGNFEENINALIIDYDLYSFFGLGNRFALHLNPKLEFADKRKPLYDLEIGVLLSIPKKEDKSVLFNSELFYEFYDLSNSLQKETSIINRNNIGLRFTFPIAINSFVK